MRKTTLLLFIFTMVFIFTQCKREKISVPPSEQINSNYILIEENDTLSFDVINFNYHLDGVSVSYEYFESNFDEILYSDFPDTSNVYCFTSLENYEDYLELTLNPYKDSLLRDFHIMDSIAALHEGELVSKVPVNINQIATLNGSTITEGYHDVWGGAKVIAAYPNTNLGSYHNNSVTIVKVWSALSCPVYATWCIKKYFGGSRAVFWASVPFFGRNYNLTNTKWNDKFMSVY